MAEQTRADWRPPTDTDWRRLRTLLRDVMIHLQLEAENWEQAAEDVRAASGESWSIGSGRYADRVEKARTLARLVEDEYRALEGGHERKVPLDDRGMFPDTLAP